MHGCGSIGRAGGDVGDLGALLDVRLLIVGRDDPRARDHLPQGVRLQGGKLEVDEVAAAEIYQGERKLSGGIRDREVHVELRRIRVARVGDPRSQFVGRLCPRFPGACRAAAGHDRRRRQRAAEAAGITALQREPGLDAKAHAKLPAELVAGDHDTAFDQDLPHRDVDLADHAPHFLEP